MFIFGLFHVTKLTQKQFYDFSDSGVYLDINGVKESLYYCCDGHTAFFYAQSNEAIRSQKYKLADLTLICHIFDVITVNLAILKEFSPTILLFLINCFQPFPFITSIFERICHFLSEY